MSGGLVRQDFEAGKYYPEQSGVCRFSSPNPEGRPCLPQRFNFADIKAK